MVFKYMCSEYKNNYKKEFKKCIEELKHKDTFFRQIPNLLTFFRGVSMIPVNLLFLTGHPIAAIVLAGVALSTDFFDGKIARKYHLQSKFGADLDAVCDKVVLFGLSLPLVISHPLFLVNLLLEGFIGYVNVVGRMKGVDTSTIFEGKVKTWILSLTLLSGYVTHFFSVPVSIFTSMLSLSAFLQAYVLAKYNGILKESEKNGEVQNVDQDCDMLQEEVTLEERKDRIASLTHEKEFLLGSQEPVCNKPKCRTKKREEKNSL